MEQFTKITKALSDQNRVRAIMALRNGELCLCQLIELLRLAPSTVSRHMLILKQAGLVTCRKENRWVYYSLISNKTSSLEMDFLSLLVKSLNKSPIVLSDSKKIKSIKCK